MKIRILFSILLVVMVSPIVAQEEREIVLGVDLSYVNEMEDCGAVYHVDGEPRDPYQIFADYGANLMRVRLWHTPDWTDYSTLPDVERSIGRAKALGMKVLLDFHNSDTWADPGKQIIPAAWEGIADVNDLAQALYDYLYDTLTELDSRGLMPDMVQVGNEINTEVLRAEGAAGYPINWARNALLINSGIRAVRDAGATGSINPRVMLHVAKPEEVEGWLRSARRAGVTDFDIVGISYYPGWSNHSLRTLDNVVSQIRERFEKDVIIAETAYPFTLDGAPDNANNIPNTDFLLEGYPASPEGQRQFLIDLTQTVLDAGGLGVIYWEPGWVSTRCETLWGRGSHWDNATFFDFANENEVLPGIEFLGYGYTQ